MKLRNKKTGEIGKPAFIGADYEITILPEDKNKKARYYKSLAELNEDWEDYEEPKGKVLYWMILTLENFIENEPDDKWIDLEDCKQMLEKLKAWKRLKDAGFRITGWDNSIGDDYYKPAQIVIRLNNDPDNFDEYDDIEPFKSDLDLLFGGEE